jgi:hypothetical protein
VAFIRRLFGGGERAGDATGGAGPDDGREATDAQADEAARERDLLRADAARLDNDLLQRQLRYADRSWTPPAQGGTRRADDEEGSDDG